VKTVIVKPERCVGCHQCSFECAVTHSSSKTRMGAISEAILSKPRIRVYLSQGKENFPNKCRHCEPAPCEMACITKAIYRDAKSGIVLINRDRCINCGMCAMACPFAVVRYYPYVQNREAAHKCDQCIDRQAQGQIPACVAACKVGALLFDEVNKVMDKDTERLASLIYLGIREKVRKPGDFSSLVAYKQKLNEIRRRQS
jgi:anaerobic carbon-monoxide dehydrogenase iron sulfur subunit